MNRRTFLRVAGGGSVAAAAGCAGGGGGEDFPSRDVEMIVPFGPGGGFDFYARLVANVLEEEDYVPVDVRVRNMEGAAGITGTNHIWDAEPDGYTVGIQHGGLLPLDPITKPEVAEYDPREITYLPRVGGTTRTVAVSTETDVTTGDEFLAAAADGELTFSHQGPESAPAIQMLALAELGGDDTYSASQYRRNSVGYDGRSDEYAALLRGEVQVMNGSFRSLRQFVEAGDLRFVLFFTTDESCHEQVSNPGCDTLATLDAEIDNANEIIGFSGGRCHRYFIGPPDIPEDRRSYLCDAISSAINDPVFRERAREAGRSVFYGDCETTRECIVGKYRTFRDNEELLEELGLLN